MQIGTFIRRIEKLATENISNEEEALGIASIKMVLLALVIAYDSNWHVANLLAHQSRLMILKMALEDERYSYLRQHIEEADRIMISNPSTIYFFEEDASKEAT